jgi:hypothetical protein
VQSSKRDAGIISVLQRGAAPENAWAAYAAIVLLRL